MKLTKIYIIYLRLNAQCLILYFTGPVDIEIYTINVKIAIFTRRIFVMILDGSFTANFSAIIILVLVLYDIRNGFESFRGSEWIIHKL